jgi:2-polyprenyl-3-methyl-5-hydroxy-6-metoxy-1,4-benzoquinol methylase
MSDPPGYYRNTRAEVLPLLPTGYRTVLEIGCGAGTFATLLSRDAEIWGVEPSDEAAAAATHLHRLLHGRYEEVESQVPTSYFDLVICNDVIEHIADSTALLASIRTKLRPGGHFVGSVPNVRFVKNLFNLLVRKDWRYEDSGILDRTHLRFFTAKSLRRSLEEHGYAIEEFRGINSAFRQVQGLKSLLKAVGTTVVVGVTLGWWYDVQFLQWAFRVTPRRDP